MSGGGEPARRGTLPSPNPTYFALNLRSELPSYVSLNLRSNQPLPLSLRTPDRHHLKDDLKRRCTLRRVCCGLLEVMLLCPVVLCLCGVVLLPSAVYFIPREFFNFPSTLSNASSQLSSLQDNQSLAEQIDDGNCSQGFFRDPNITNSNSCRPSCEELALDGSGVGGFSFYRIAVMVAAALSCASALCFLALSLTLKKETL